MKNFKEQFRGVEREEAEVEPNEKIEWIANEKGMKKYKKR